MADLFDTAPIFDLPLEKGGDLHFVLVYEPAVLDENGDPVLGSDGKPTFAEADWPEGSTVATSIDTDPATVIDGVIEGSEATFDLDYLEADQIKPRLLWRAKMTHASGLDEVLVKGVTRREDGKS